MTRIYHPLLSFNANSHQTRGKMKGKGVGSVLLDGGLGGQSSYSSIDDYINTTGRNPNTLSNMGGMGLVKTIPNGMKKEEMNSKIKNMLVNPKKVKNIKFNL